MATLRYVPTCGRETAHACIACRYGEILSNALVVSFQSCRISSQNPPTVGMHRWNDAQEGGASRLVTRHGACTARARANEYKGRARLSGCVRSP
jgi:hypothetical protein